MSMRPRMKADDFFNLPESLGLFASFFPAESAPWAWLPAISRALAGVGGVKRPVAAPSGLHIEGEVHIADGVKLPSHGTLLGPAWIGPGCELRPGVFVRGNVIVGAGAVLGNACEFKNCLLLDGVQVPHFSYVGDSILGNKAHLGAGVICSNLRLDQRPVSVRSGDAVISTGLRKFGAVLGDGAEVGCNAVLNPGTVLGRRVLVAPGTVVSGHVADGMMVRNRHELSVTPRRD